MFVKSPWRKIKSNGSLGRICIVVVKVGEVEL